MVMCFVPLCNHYSEQKTCRFGSRFLTFPANPDERKRWMKLIKKDREPTKYSLVCSCHFKDGQRKNGPTIFDHNSKRRSEFSSRQQRNKIFYQTEFVDMNDFEEPTTEDNRVAESSTTNVNCSTENVDGCIILPRSEPFAAEEGNISSSSSTISVTSATAEHEIIEDCFNFEPIINEPRTPTKRKKNWNFRYIEDVEFKDLECPVRRRRFWEMALAKVREQQMVIKIIRKRNRRLHHRLQTLEGLP